MRIVFIYESLLLAELELFQLATFEKGRLEFASGLNILSGMSGAGKSVVLKALDLALGGRFTQRLMREGAEQSEVRALFVLPEILRKSFAEELALEGDEILVRRVFRREGRTSNYINDRMVSVDLIKRIGSDLARVLNQDEALGLRDPDHQLAILDLFGSLGSEVETYEKEYTLWRSKVSDCEKLRQDAKDAVQREQFGKFQLKELNALNLRDGEFQELNDEINILANGAELESNGALVLLAAEKFVNQAQRPLEELQTIVGELEGWRELLEEGSGLLISCEEWTRIFRQQMSQLEFDPERLQMVEDRFRQLSTAFKKFAMEEAPLIEYRNELKTQMDAPPVDVEIERLSAEITLLEKKLKKMGQALHQHREKAARELSVEVNKILTHLEMGGERFSIELQIAELKRNGPTDSVFTLRPTADASAKPLHETASGGERSRALLAISSALKGSLGCPILVFDEIDTNMGARLGRPISEAFLNLSKGAQVLCVTHLAPVAACGGRHFVVEKGASISEVRCLDEEQRVLELAHMTAGDRNSTKAQEQAREMLDLYRNRTS